MRGPDAAAGRGARKHNPPIPHAVLRGSGTVEQADRNEARNKTDEASKHDQSQIMLAGKARQNAKHHSTTLPSGGFLPRSHAVSVKDVERPNDVINRAFVVSLAFERLVALRVGTQSFAGSTARNRLADAESSVTADCRAFSLKRPISPEMARAPRNSPPRSNTGTETAATCGSRSPSEME